MTFTEHYDAVVAMYNYFKLNNVTNSQDEIVKRIADRFGIEPSRRTFHRLKDDMCHVFNCDCIYDSRTKRYNIIECTL